MNGNTIYDQIIELVEDFCKTLYGEHPHNTGIFNAMVLVTDKHTKMYGAEATFNLLQDLKDYRWADLGDCIIVDTKSLDTGKSYSIKITFNGIEQDYAVSV